MTGAASEYVELVSELLLRRREGGVTNDEEESYAERLNALRDSFDEEDALYVEKFVLGVT